MDDGERQSDDVHDSAASEPHEEASATAPQQPPFGESLVEEVSALIDDGRTYAQAELTFQKTRAKLAGRAVGVALAALVVAIILLHIAFLALAVGLVMALAPLVTIWGAIGIVVGALLLLTGVLVYVAAKNGRKIGALFASSGDEE